MVVVDDMLGKVPKLRYSYHDVHNATKFLYLADETYLEKTKEIGPLGKSIMEPVQWIMGLHNFDIMNLLDITHFGCGTSIKIYVKQLLSRVHSGILWMDRLV